MDVVFPPQLGSIRVIPFIITFPTLACIRHCRQFSTQRLILFSALLTARFARSISLTCVVAYDHNQPVGDCAFLTGRLSANMRQFLRGDDSLGFRLRSCGTRRMVT